jgi:hypothetical protein
LQTSERQTVTVCIDPFEDFHIIAAARMRAEKIFETAGVGSHGEATSAPTERFASCCT